MLVMNSIALAICVGFVLAAWMVPNAWLIFATPLKQSISIMICVVFVASIQNYIQELRFRGRFLLRKHVHSNFIRIDALQEETEQLLLNILPVHVAKQ